MRVLPDNQSVLFAFGSRQSGDNSMGPDGEAPGILKLIQNVGMLFRINPLTR
jgi:hypothetical protein